MADDGHQEQEYASTDPVGAANATHESEDVATEPKETYAGSSGDSDTSLGQEKQEKEGLRPDVTRTLTTTTTRSSFTVESTTAEPIGKKPWYKRLNPLKRSTRLPVPKQRIVSREYGASFFSLLTFQWMAPLMSKGYQRPLELNDIWLVNPNRAVDLLAENLSASFQRRVARGDKYPLIWALHETFKFEFWLGGTCQLFASLCQVMSPFTLRFLIAFANNTYLAAATGKPTPHIGDGIGLVIGITAMQMLQSMGTNHFIYRGQIVGAQARGVLITVIFEKAMRLSGRAKAGGKAIEGIEKDEEKPKTLEEKQNFIKHIINNRLRPTGGPQVTKDKGQGISGDGAGWGNGRIVNLMSTDTYRVDQASGMFHMVWTSPVAILITLVVLLINLTYSALAGFALLVIGIPALTKAIKVLFARRRAINKITDQRVSLTQEILQAVRFVKYFGWESSFLERIGGIRKREIRKIQVLLAIRNAINACSMSLPIFASFLSFITYSLSQHVLDPAPIFSSLALFNSLRMPLNLLPLVIGQVVDAWSSLGRIQDFLIAEEQVDDFLWDMEGKNAITASHADFTWERTITQDPDNQAGLGPKKKQSNKDRKFDKRNLSANPPAKAEDGAANKDNALEVANADSASDTTQVEPFKLLDMDLTIGRGELVAVIGGVGSGKSSLLAALAGDMRRTTGSITMGATRAFCPQYPWIQNTSVRDNIVFGKDYDRKWYDAVIDACALRPDLEMLPNGDMTEIGERGITVSGGQKQRLNIARAIYFKSDLILMVRKAPIYGCHNYIARASRISCWSLKI